MAGYTVLQSQRITLSGWSSRTGEKVWKRESLWAADGTSMDAKYKIGLWVSALFGLSLLVGALGSYFISSDVDQILQSAIAITRAVAFFMSPWNQRAFLSRPYSTWQPTLSPF